MHHSHPDVKLQLSFPFRSTHCAHLQADVDVGFVSFVDVHAHAVLHLVLAHAPQPRIYPEIMHARLNHRLKLVPAGQKQTPLGLFSYFNASQLHDKVQVKQNMRG
jgi:hypothetical protein